MESVTLKGTKAMILPIIFAIVLNNANITFTVNSKNNNTSNNELKLYNEVESIQADTLDYLILNDFDLSSPSKKAIAIKNKDLFKKALNKNISVTITGEKDLLKPYVLEMIYDNKIKIEFDKDKIDKNDCKLIGGCIELENGGSVETGTRDGIRCGLLTGSVVLNRTYYCSWCPDTIREVLYQKGQYALNTINKLDSVKITKKVNQIAEFLLIFGPICPENVVYQSQNKNLGSDHYDKIRTPEGKIEYFAYE